MSLANHRDWINNAATQLLMGGDILWQALSAEWVNHCLPPEEARKIIQPIEDAKLGSETGYSGPITINISTIPTDANGNTTLFELSLYDAQGSELLPLPCRHLNRQSGLLALRLSLIG